MPLSEHEQRLLEEMERSLYQNDADFVATVGARRGRPSYRAIVLGILIAVLGVGVLIAGVTFGSPIVGILGFVVMFAGVLLAIAPSKRAGSADAAAAGQASSPVKQAKATHAGFMNKLNDRWDKRQDGQS